MVLASKPPRIHSPETGDWPRAIQTRIDSHAAAREIPSFPAIRYREWRIRIQDRTRPAQASAATGMKRVGKPKRRLKILCSEPPEAKVQSWASKPGCHACSRRSRQKYSLPWGTGKAQRSATTGILAARKGRKALASAFTVGKTLPFMWEES